MLCQLHVHLIKTIVTLLHRLQFLFELKVACHEVLHVVALTILHHQLLALMLERLNHVFSLLQFGLHLAHVFHSLVVEHLDLVVEVLLESLHVSPQLSVLVLEVVQLPLLNAELALRHRQDLLVAVNLHKQVLLLICSHLSLMLVL